MREMLDVRAKVLTFEIYAQMVACEAKIKYFDFSAKYFKLLSILTRGSYYSLIVSSCCF